MSAAADPPVPTLGAWLAIQVRELVSRRLATTSWLPALGPVLRRAASHPVASGSRLRRLEAQVPALDVPNTSAAQPRPFDYPLPHHEPTGADLPSLPTRLRERPRPLVDPRSEPDPGSPLPADIRERLAPITGPGADQLRIHHDGAADTLARAHQAAAVTVAQQISFRSGQFRPREPEGFALLVHEATHALEAMRPNSAWRRATTPGAAEEEHLAAARERAVRNPGRPERASGPALRTTRRPEHPTERAEHLPATPAVAGFPLASPERRAMAAPERRDLDLPAARNPAAEPDRIGPRDALYRELRHQIKVEWERGG